MDLLTVFFLILSLTVDNGFSVKIKDDDFSYRLPNNTYPNSYTLTLVFNDFGQHETPMTYVGTVGIDIKIIDDTDTIVLHSSVDKFEGMSLNVINEINQIDVDYEVDKEKELLIVKTKSGEILRKNVEVLLRINFIGLIGVENEGVFLSSYLDENSEKKYFLATHMQPFFARRVFPCYDEPKFKSFFTLSLIYSTGYNSISNMDKDGPDTNLQDQVVRIFKTTPLIPTYLLAFVISDFESFEVIENDTTFRGFSRPEQVENTKMAVDTAIKAMKLFEIYFDAKHEMEKLDQVALPHFNFAGMENYGIIFYNEDFLLHQNGVSSVENKELLVTSVFHQVCHTFIGNSITYEWWSYLWISEGFCKFFEYNMAHFLHPDMKLDELFAVNVMQSAMIQDSSLKTRPMTFAVETPDEISRIFDFVSYNKAASVIRMFSIALSEETFQKSLQIFISKETSNPEGIVTPEHYYEALRYSLQNNSFDVANAFRTWELQAGYPIVFVDRNYNGNSIRITQKKFTDDFKDDNYHDELWAIPITYSAKNLQTALPAVEFWLKNSSADITIAGMRPSDYFLLNINQIGYFRVMYDEANWILISNELNKGDFNYFSPNTRAMLIDDAAVFVNTGILNMRIFLELIKYLEHEKDYIPWVAATNHLQNIQRMLNDDNRKTYRDFQKFLQTLFKKVFEFYGTTEQYNSEHFEKNIRNIAINWACQAHFPDCLNQTAQMLNRIITETDFVISVDHENVIMCSGARTADKLTFDRLWELYEFDDKKFEKRTILETIGCIENEEILGLFIRKFDQVDDDWLTVIQAVYLNGPIGVKVALEFLDNDFEIFNSFIKKRNEQESLLSIFQGMSVRILTAEMLEDYSYLMIKYDLSTHVKESLAAVVQENLMWIEKFSPIIQAFLDDNSNAGRSSVSVMFIMLGFSIIHFVK